LVLPKLEKIFAGKIPQDFSPVINNYVKIIPDLTYFIINRIGHT